MTSHFKDRSIEQCNLASPLDYFRLVVLSSMVSQDRSPDHVPYHSSDSKAAEPLHSHLTPLHVEVVQTHDVDHISRA
jgi:hypothetical protein